MNRFNKVLLLMLIIYIFSFAYGCGKIESDMEGIKNLVQQEIYEQKEDKYLVFFYREGCSGCENVKPIVLKYIEYRKGRDECRKIYGFNLSNEKNSVIYREYTPEDDTIDFYVNKVTEWDKLYIASTPALLSVKKVNGVKQTSLVCSGDAKIKSYLNDELNKR